MKFDPEKCPKCGDEPKGTCEHVPGTALIQRDKNGNWEYSGETVIHWDGQTTDTDANGDALLECGTCWHIWPAKLTETPGDEEE